MDEDGSIPDHVNDGVPLDEIARFERFGVMLYILAGRGDVDAACITKVDMITRMKRNAFINAAINNNKAVNKKLAKAYPGIKDYQGLIERLRLEVIMRRLDGQ